MAFNQDKVQSVDFFKRIGACAVKAADKRAKKRLVPNCTWAHDQTILTLNLKANEITDQWSGKEVFAC